MLRPARAGLAVPFVGPAILGVGAEIHEVNADGTCATKVAAQRRATLFGATWQPGPGREAGPISC